MSDQTPTITLRAPTDDDFDLLYRVAAELDTWEERSPSMPAPLTRAAYEQRLSSSSEDPATSMRFVVEADGVAVGGVSMFEIDPLARNAEVGITLAQDARGRGIGTLAVARLAEFAFVRCNLRRLHLQAIASNAAAIRAYEKAGFVVEGRQREHAWVRGAYEDIVRMGLLRSEWEAARA